MVCVYKNDLACLATEITQLKQTLPLVLNKSHQQSQISIQELQKGNFCKILGDAYRCKVDLIHLQNVSIPVSLQCS